MGDQGELFKFKIMSSNDIHRRLLKEQFPEIDLPEDSVAVFIEDYLEQLPRYKFCNHQKFNKLSEKLLNKGSPPIRFDYILRQLKPPLLLAPNVEDFSSTDLIIFNITNRQFYILHKGKVKMLNMSNCSFRLKSQLVAIAKQTNIELMQNSLNGLFKSYKYVKHSVNHNNVVLETHSVNNPQRG
ncbi:MAG: hypothetical protein KBD37_04335 [Burkholderiales bacterium]|nr:hypothetical protein [Burkholderiales bacterium]